MATKQMNLRRILDLKGRRICYYSVTMSKTNRPYHDYLGTRNYPLTTTQRVSIGIKDDKDINEAFSEILLSEEHLHKAGYEEGFCKSLHNGNTEAYHLGYHRGAELGAELGYYLSVAERHIHLLSTDMCAKSQKTVKRCEILKQLILAFPKDNSEDVDILGLIDDIRTVYKKCCSLLKIDASFPEPDKLSF